MSKTLPQLTASTAPDLDDEVLATQDGNPRRVTIGSILDLNDMIHVVGVNSTGTDTPALAAAIALANAASPKKAVYVSGTLAYDPSSAVLASAVPLYVNGVLKPSTTIVLGSGCSIIGLGGASAGGAVPFQRSSNCYIIGPSNLAVPCIEVQGSANHSLKNITMNGAYTGILCNGAWGTNIGSHLDMENVQIRTNNAAAGFTTTSSCLKMDAFFWTWCRNCGFSTSTGYKTLIITNSFLVNNHLVAGYNDQLPETPSANDSGLNYFIDCSFAAKGIILEGGLGSTGNVYFKNTHTESMDETFCTASDIFNLTFDQIGLSDSYADAFDFSGGGVSAFRIENASWEVTFNEALGYPAAFMNMTNPSTISSGHNPDFGSNQFGKFIHVGGETDTRLLSRSHAGLPVGAIGTGANVALVPATSGSITVTSGQKAPDGSATAYLVSNASSSPTALTISSGSLDVNGGDFIIVSGWFCSYDEGVGLANAGSTSGPLRLVLTSAQSLTFEGPTTFTSSANPAVATHGPIRWANIGWVPLYGLATVVGTRSGTPGATITLNAYLGHDYYFWGMNYRVVKAADGFSRSSLVKYMDSLGSIPVGLTGGTTGLQAHQTFRTGLNTSANRPTASTVGAGAQFYDTTLNKPIWSTGSVWKDAAGTTV